MEITNRASSTFSASSAEFLKIPGYPIAYWTSQTVRDAFAKGQPLGSLAKPRQGLATADNDTFRRLWHEVSANKIGFSGYSDVNKWFSYNSGGSFRKWFGNQYYIVNWENDGHDIKQDKLEKLAQGKCLPSNSKPKNTEFYFRESVSWSKIGAGNFSVRYFPPGFIFDVAGCSIFQRNDRCLKYLAGLLNSCVAEPLLSTMSGTINFEVGHIKAIPILDDLKGMVSSDKLIEMVDECIELSKLDWEGFETAWAYNGDILLSSSAGTLQEAYTACRLNWAKQVSALKSAESFIDHFFCKKYDLSTAKHIDEGTSRVTLDRNPLHRYDPFKSHSELEALLLADTMREFISYAVGCMLGRYSLDKPGLILANQGETADDYRQQIPEPTFAPDEDNVIPLLDGDWFEDDITERFKAFLKVTFGTEHYEENLKFLEDALYPDNLTAKKRKTIRDYFLKDFFSHHIKLYKKRPIYWLFSSPKGTFNALIYMHRYRPDTVGTVLHYLRDFRDKLTHHADHQQMLADSASASKSEKTQAIKDVAAIKKQLKELEDYEKALFEVAARKIDIDLDDGVKHNYQLFGSVLRKIPGLDAKED
jgi:hypothetical protein